MNRTSSHSTYRTLSFSESHEDNHRGILELCAKPARKLLVWHPEGVNWIFRTDRWLHHVPSRTLSVLLGPTSLLWAEGARHTAYRRVLGPALHGPSLQAYHHSISHTVHAALVLLVPGTVFSPIEWSRKVTLRIISQILLGRSDDLLLELFSARVDNVLRSRTLAYHCLHASTSSWIPFFHGRRELDKMLLKSAKATTNFPSPPLAALLLVEKGPLGALGDRELTDQLISLLFAGHETTASATAWTLYWLSRDDTVRRDVTAELNATSSDGSNPAQVPLLNAVIHEALRLSSPAFIAGKRMLTVDGELLGKPVTAGTIVTPCMYLAHRQPDLFPNPHRFDPNRFLGKRIPRQHYFPFGGGTRHCLGRELAMLEVRMITAAVLRHCQFHCMNPEAGTPVLRGPAMTVSPDLRMVVTSPQKTRETSQRE
jgi:cytochrome P450 family 110